MIIKECDEDCQELGKPDFEVVDAALHAFIASNPEPLALARAKALKEAFRDARTAFIVQEPN